MLFCWDIHVLLRALADVRLWDAALWHVSTGLEIKFGFPVSSLLVIAALVIAVVNCLDLYLCA